ncbi:NADP-dependent oxidoreductase domain-containing protein [Mycena albidolilacea]|uniref:NADP-dependent oxidoreductase domain-containing protein n=1 Tax=Mycena albidolilacea TaxID=1033008 RepID=A0AAD7E907_9AGAR|nr:NADP-dependent oxidoreductase domain-containing protein [Mycena albidolilacea]
MPHLIAGTILSCQPLLGRKFLKKYDIPRSKVVIMTKVHHLVVHDDPSKFGFMHPALCNTRDYDNQDGLLRAGIFNAVEASLKRLDTPYIDVLQIHRFDPRAEVKETMRALHDLVVSGKALHRRELDEDVEEREMIPYCRAHGIALIPHFALATGALSRPPLVPGNRANAGEIIHRVEEVAGRKGCTMTQVALAVRLPKIFLSPRRCARRSWRSIADVRTARWIQLKVDSPTIGLGSVERVEQAAQKGVELTEEEVKYLEEPYVPKADRGYA